MLSMWDFICTSKNPPFEQNTMPPLPLNYNQFHQLNPSSHLSCIMWRSPPLCSPSHSSLIMVCIPTSRFPLLLSSHVTMEGRSVIMEGRSTHILLYMYHGRHNNLVVIPLHHTIMLPCKEGPLKRSWNFSSLQFNMGPTSSSNTFNDWSWV